MNCSCEACENGAKNSYFDLLRNATYEIMAASPEGIIKIMLLDEKEVAARLESPLNLMNRLRRQTSNGVAIFNVPSVSEGASSPLLPPKAEDLMSDIDDKIKGGAIQKKALAVLDASLSELEASVGDIKPERLAGVASEMSKIILNVRESNRSDSGERVQVLVYAPQIAARDTFEAIQVGD